KDVPNRAKRILRVPIDIRDVLDGTAEDRPPAGAPSVWHDREFSAQGVDALRRPPRVGGEVEQLSVESKDGAELRIAELHGALSDRFEHRLYVGRRAGDYAKDLTRCRLLLQRFAHLSMGCRKLLVLRLQLREQPHVLDGDDRLVGEGGHQL